MADPDLQIRRGGGHPHAEITGGGGSQKKLPSALRVSVWSKNKRGRAPRGPPLDPPLYHIDFGLSQLKMLTFESLVEIMCCVSHSKSSPVGLFLDIEFDFKAFLEER